MMTPYDAYLADPARPSPALPASASPSEAVRTWVTATRDTEREAWRALYAALHPRPGDPDSPQPCAQGAGGGGAGGRRRCATAAPDGDPDENTGPARHPAVPSADSRHEHARRTP